MPPMKRALDVNEPSSFTHPQQQSSDASPRSKKRVKAVQACISCRKYKTRCELYDGIKCHRCNVLNLSCSFEGQEPPPIKKQTASSEETASTATQPEKAAVVDPHRDTGGATTDNPQQREPLVRQAMGSLHSQVSESASSGDPPHESDRSGHPAGFDPEELLPNPTTPWGFLKESGGNDWTTVPMLTMQDLLRRPKFGEALGRADYNISLAGILTNEQTKHLLDIFEKQYVPWLNLSAHQDTTSPLVVLVRCLVASRHMEHHQRVVVTPQLQKLVDEVIPKLVFSTVPTTDAMQALLILSFWAPVSESPQSNIRDGRLLVASAISLAMNMRLSQATHYVAQLKEQRIKEKGLSSHGSAELLDATDKARLWLALTNVEAMLCLGTGRSPLYHRPEVNHHTNEPFSFASLESSRDMRLNWIERLYTVTEQGIRIPINTYSEVDRWYRELTQSLHKLSDLHRIILPIPVLVEHDNIYFGMLQVFYYGCRLQVLLDNMKRVREVVVRERHIAYHRWFDEVKTAGNPDMIMHLGGDVTRTSDMVIISFLREKNMQLLSTAPDILFATIALSATITTIVRFSVLQASGKLYPSSADALLNKAVEKLRNAAASSNHAPARCARLISSLISTWEQRTKHLPRPQRWTGHLNPIADDEATQATETSHTIPCGSDHLDYAISAERFSSQTHGGNENTGYPRTTQNMPSEPSAASPAYMTGVAGPSLPNSTFDVMMPDLIPNYGFDHLMTTDMFIDTDFWSSCMNNLGTEAGFGGNSGI